MPRKPVIDRERVRAALEEAGSANAAAKLLGMHTNTVLFISRELKGLCTRCGREPQENGRYCAACQKWTADRQRVFYNKRKDRGACLRCGKPTSENGSQFCEEHRLVRVADNKRLRAKYREERGDDWKALVSRWNRRQLYGDAGPAVWARANRQCEVCGAPWKPGKLHLHHIDEDKSHNTEDNLICICRHCHNLLHYIKWHPNLTAFLPWFRTTYPDVPI